MPRSAWALLRRPQNTSSSANSEPWFGAGRRCRAKDFSEFVAWALACRQDPQKALAEYLDCAYPQDEAGRKSARIAWEAAGISEDGGAVIPQAPAVKGRKKKAELAADHRQLADFLIQALASLDAKAHNKLLAALPEAQRSELAQQLMEILKK